MSELNENKQVENEEVTKEQNEENIKQKVVETLKDNTVDATPTGTEIVDNFLPNSARNLPMENMDFLPTNPQKFYHSFILNDRHLVKRIYLEMLRAIYDYERLKDIAPASNKTAIDALQNQMQILSVTMLNIYRQIDGRGRMPIITNRRTQLSSNYQTALSQMYNRVFHIHELTVRLLARTGNQFRNTLIIVIANLKSQLRNLENLKNNR